MKRIIIVPVSGGKDSQVVLSLALKTKHTIRCVHQNTGYDHKDTYKQIRAMEKFYGVKIEHTKNKYGGMFGFLEHAQYFPNSSARGCTSRLKQEPFMKWLQENGFNCHNCEIWFGMRSDESAARTNKYGGLSPHEKFTLGDVSDIYNGTKELRETIGCIPMRLPIVHLTTKEVFDYIKKEGAPLNKLYSKGHHRVGCYPCLLAKKSEWELAGKDKLGREHIQKLIDFEDKWAAEGNPRKFIKVHRAWDVREFLKESNGSDLPDLDESTCSWCSI